MKGETIYGVSLWGLVILPFAVLLLFESAPKFLYAGILGESGTAKVQEVRKVQRRDCGSGYLIWKLPCLIGLNDRNEPRYIYKMEINDIHLVLEATDFAEAGKAIQIRYSKAKPEYVHINGSTFENMYLMFFGGLFMLTLSIGSFVHDRRSSGE